MPSYSNKSKQKLSTAHDDLQEIFNVVICNFDNTILDGHRDQARQDRAFNEGFSQVQFPNSKHNKVPSMAVDAVPYPIEWDNLNRMRFFAGRVIATGDILYSFGMITHKVRWGGDWDKDTVLKDNRFNDFPHFELYKP